MLQATKSQAPSQRRFGICLGTVSIQNSDRLYSSLRKGTAITVKNALIYIRRSGALSIVNIIIWW